MTLADAATESGNHTGTEFFGDNDDNSKTINPSQSQSEESTSLDLQSIDTLTRELVILTRVRRALLLRGRQCLALMSPRRQQLVALLRRQKQVSHAIDRVGSVSIVGNNKRRLMNAQPNHSQSIGGGDRGAHLVQSISVFPFANDHVALSGALDAAIGATVGAHIWRE